MTVPDKKIQGLIYPKEFFERNELNVEEGLCFVIMPFEEKIDAVYTTVICKALSECGLTALRADKIFDTKPIMISVMEKIAGAELIIADVTGRNPNVFYELGMAHMVKDRVILITQDIEDVLFDLRHFRHIVYKNNRDGLLALHQSLLKTLRALGLERRTKPVPSTKIIEAVTERKVEIARKQPPKEEKPRFVFPFEVGQREAIKTEKANVQSAVDNMMVANCISRIPNPVSSATPTNDMNAFPDTTSDDDTNGDKVSDPNNNAYTIAIGNDLAGYLLYGHDETGDNAAIPVQNYMRNRYTTYYYTVDSDGTVHQWFDASKTGGELI